MNVSQRVDLLSRITATLPTAASPVGYYELRIYSPAPGALEEDIFGGDVSGTTITFLPGGAFGIIMNANQTYVIEVLQTTAPPPPPP